MGKPVGRKCRVHSEEARRAHSGGAQHSERPAEVCGSRRVDAGEEDDVSEEVAARQRPAGHQGVVGLLDAHGLQHAAGERGTSATRGGQAHERLAARLVPAHARLVQQQVSGRRHDRSVCGVLQRDAHRRHVARDRYVVAAAGARPGTRLELLRERQDVGGESPRERSRPGPADAARQHVPGIERPGGRLLGDDADQRRLAGFSATARLETNIAPEDVGLGPGQVVGLVELLGRRYRAGASSGEELARPDLGLRSRVATDASRTDAHASLRASARVCRLRAIRYRRQEDPHDRRRDLQDVVAGRDVEDHEPVRQGRVPVDPDGRRDRQVRRLSSPGRPCPHCAGGAGPHTPRTHAQARCTGMT